MRITWSLPTNGERLGGTRGDLVRASRLIQALRADGHDVQVVESAAQPLAEAAVTTYRRVVRRLLPRRPGLTLRDLGRWARARAHGRRVASAARDHEADVIIETQVHFAGSGERAARETDLPLLLDDCSPVSETVALGAGLPALAQHVFRRQVESARWVTVSSAALRERLERDGVPARKLHVVPNGVDLATYGCSDRDGVRRRLGLNGRPVIGFVGSFQRWHGVDRLVEALVPLLGRTPVHLLLVGDGPERARVISTADRLGVSAAVTWVGAVPPQGVAELISACDIGALPATNDYGQPMKLLEYAAAGLPSVAPDLPPVREVIEDGVTGLLFAPQEREALPRALARLLADQALARAMGNRARARVADASWQHRARALVARVAATL